jgi:hypothetical protein
MRSAVSTRRSSVCVRIDLLTLLTRTAEDKMKARAPAAPVDKAVTFSEACARVVAVRVFDWHSSRA